jgi:single-strand DNA-binding protein
MGVNRVLLLGNLGQDPELRYTPSQQAVTTLRIATGEKRKNSSGEWVEHTEWHSVVVWGKQAETCNQYLSKGRQIFVEGRLQTSKWQDKEGNARYKTEIIASAVQFVGGGRGENTGGEKSYSSSDDESTGVSGSNQNISLDDDDIPF